jgi:glutamine synthetase
LSQRFVHKSPPNGMLTIAALQELAQQGEIDTVQIVFTDHVGRLMGKRYSIDFFLDSGIHGTHVCTYLLTVDIETQARPGFSLANWERGYGDFHLVPDLATLRRCAWLPKTAMVQCDVYQTDPTTQQDVNVPESPRSILKHQLDCLHQQMGSQIQVDAASELEYYLFKETYETAQKKQFRDLDRFGWFLEDYNMLQSTRSEVFHQPARELIQASGIPVENTKGEAGHGQHELNVRFSDVLRMADNHVVFKQAMKEIADQMGLSVSFMAKVAAGDAGSSCHMHLNLFDTTARKNLFAGDIDEAPGVRCSPIFRHFLAGWMHHLPDLTPFYCPTVNSYKRFVNASWAPTRIAWSVDNRTAGFRVVGSGKSLRIECRIPGADCNPYLGFAAALASGLDGIQQKMEPLPVFSGDLYKATHLPSMPGTLREAAERFRNSTFARAAFGDRVVDHYAHHFTLEDQAFQAHVTDWERRRYFEQI